MNIEAYYLLQNFEFDIRYSIFNAFAFPDADHGHGHVHVPSFARILMHE